MQDNTIIKRKKIQNKQVSDFTIQDLLKIILVKKWLILSILVIVVGGAIYYVQIIPPTYKSSVSIVRELNSSEMMGVRTTNDRIEQGQLFIIKGPTALREISDKIAKEYGFTISTADIYAGISLTIDEKTGNTITITVTANTPEYVQAIANVTAEVLKDKMDEVKMSNLSQGTDFLKQQMDLMEKKMQDSEQALNDFRDREEIIAKSSNSASGGLLDSASGGLLGKLGDMQSQAIQIENEVELKRTQVKTLGELIVEKKKSAQTSSAPEKTIQLDQLRERLISLQSDLNIKLETLTEKDPEIITLRKRIIATETQLKTEFNDLMKELNTTSLDPVAELQGLTQEYVTRTVELKGLESKGILINERLKKFRDAHPEIASKQVELIRLERQSRLNEQSYTTLAGKYQDIRLLEQMKGAGLKILDKADLPRYPVAPNKKMIISFSVIAGLFFGIMFALFLEYISDSIKTKEDIERFLELPVLGMITPLGPFNVPANAIRKRENPTLIMESKKATTKATTTVNNIQERHEPRRKSNKDILNMLSHCLIYSDNGNTKSPAVENYWNLAMSIKYVNTDKQLKSILVTSAVPGERKTTTASNLAIVKAKAGIKVLLIDADLRRPMLHRIFQQNRKSGLSDLLTIDDAVDYNTFDFENHESIRPTVQENLFLLPCGSSVSNSDTLLSSDRMRELLRALEKRFDLIIIDSAPLLIVSSVIALSKEVDGVLLAIQSGKSKRKIVINVKEVLESVNARIIGTVLTDVDIVRQYGYYYRRYYNYYYQDKDGNE